ncbi:MAG: GPW/gp25 family protein [Chloroflexi bacterium]|nr:MAG: GPW/gp25 family protein [Chloroflexota bacterium]
MRLDATGSIALVSHDREIEESIRLIVGTAHGERPMRPEYGCGIHDYVFASIDSDTAGRISSEVRSALVRWEPRIKVEGVDVTVDPKDLTFAHIEIRYSVGDTNDPRNLVFPFYTLPAEE